MTRIVELSHPIAPGMPVYQGMPAPEYRTLVSREDSAGRLAGGVSFYIGGVTLPANIGTYLDAPYHYHENLPDIAGISAARLVDVPVYVVSATGATAVGPDALGELPRGVAVLVHTGWSRHWGTPEYAGPGAPYLTADAVAVLVEAAPALVGIDALNVDDVADLTRPAHHGLLGAGIPILEHLTNLSALPRAGARLTALPPPVAGLGSFPVRAVAVLPE